MQKKFIYENEDSITKYFKEIKNGDILTQKEEITLAKRIKKGDKAAIDRLVSSNLKFVISIAKEYQGQGNQLSDLINDGNEGLIKAAYKFDHTKGFRFISYAVWWIRQSVMQGLNDNSRMVRLPANVVGKLSQIKKQIESFEMEHERTPVTGDIIDIDANFEDETNGLYEENMLPTCTSLNKTINQEGSELMDIIEDEFGLQPDARLLDDSEVKTELEKTLSVLDDRERDIIECYYGLNENYAPMNLEDIGDNYGLTKERIRQIKEKAIRKLRSNSQNLFNLMGD